MPTSKDVAAWMVAQFKDTFWLYQETIVYKIKNEFGMEFVYQNESGNLAISRVGWAPPTNKTTRSSRKVT